MTVRYVDFEGGSDAADGLSFANRKKTLTSATTGAAAGDEIRVMESPDPVSIGSATWTDRSGALTLAAGRTKTLYLDGAWTAAASVTATASTTRKQGATASQLAIAAGFTTGLVGYYALGSAQDFSSYQKITFWFRASAIVADLSIFNVALCSDAAGATPVDTMTLPVIGCVANGWVPVTIDKGSALGASIQSIAVYATSDPGAVNLILDNIVATNDIALTTPISKNTGTELWWPIRSIVDDAVILDSGVAALATATPRGYKGATESVTTYVRTPHRCASVTVAANDIHTISASGSAGNPIVISGGWSRTDMATQDSETWATGQNNYGELLGIVSRTYVTVERLNAFGVSKLVGATGNSHHLVFNSCQSCQTSADGFLLTPTASVSNARLDLADCAAVSSDVDGINCSSVALFQLIRCRAHMCVPGLTFVNANAPYLEDCDFSHNSNGITATSSEGIRMAGTNECVYNTAAGVSLTTCARGRYAGLTASDNGTVGLLFANSPMNEFYGLTTEGNTSASIDSNTGSSAENYFFNWVHDEATTVLTPVDYENARFVSVKDNGVAGAHAIYTDNGLISSEATVRHTASGIAWKIQPTSAVRQEAYPLTQRIAAVPVKANVAVTATAWLRRDHTEIAGTFRIRGGQVAGVAADVTDAIAAAADTWEQLSLSFTPTEDGVVEFEVLAYGGTTRSLYWDDFAVSVASKLNASSGDYAFTKQGAYVGEDGRVGGGSFAHS